jgi:hypothetical protein
MGHNLSHRVLRVESKRRAERHHVVLALGLLYDELGHGARGAGAEGNAADGGASKARQDACAHSKCEP